MTIGVSGGRRRATVFGAVLLTGTVAAVGLLGGAAGASPSTIDLGTAGAFSVLAGSAVTNTGSSVLGAELGTAPATSSSVTGFPPGTATALHEDDGVAQQAQVDLTTAYNQAVAAPSDHDETGVDLGGKTLTEGVYTASSSMFVTGSQPLTLNGTAGAVFIFQAGSTLITGSGSSIVLTGGMTACNVFWQVGSSATLGTSTAFQGTILAQTSITLDTGATVIGRALAETGAVTLDTNTFTTPDCSTTSSTTTTLPATSTTLPATSTTLPATSTTLPATSTTLPATSTTLPATSTTLPATSTTTPSGAGTTTTNAVTTTTIGTASTTGGSGSGGGGGATLASTNNHPLAFTGLPLPRLLEIVAALILAGMSILWAQRRTAHTDRSNNL